MPQGAAHRDDLPFVMEGVGKDVMENERRSTDPGISIVEVQFCVSIELLFRQAGKIGERICADIALQPSRIGD